MDGQALAPVDKLPRTAHAALGVLTEIIAARGKATPDGHLAVSESDWRDECDDRRISTSDSAKNRSDVMRRAFAELLDRKRVVARGGLVWLASECSAADDFTALPVAAADLALAAA